MMKEKAIHPIKLIVGLVIIISIINLVGYGIGEVKYKVENFKFPNINMEKFVKK